MSDISDKALEIENTIRFNLLPKIAELVALTDAQLEADIAALKASRPDGVNKGLASNLSVLRTQSIYSRHRVYQFIREELARDPSGAGLVQALHNAGNTSLSDVFS